MPPTLTDFSEDIRLAARALGDFGAGLFNPTVRLGVTGLAITKLDGTAKGGILLAIARELELPIRFVALGEGVDDLEEFRASEFVRALIGERAA